MDRTATNSPEPAQGEVPGTDLPKIAYGKGIRLFDVRGKDYIDGSGGPAVYCLGHAHPEVNEAIKQQLDRVAHGYRYNFTSDPLEELTWIVANQCGPGYERMIFTTGGSEAVESALKIALHFHTANGEPSRRRFIARRRSWHGNTLGALSVSEFKERRDPFEGALIPVSHLSPANTYRPPAGVAPAQVGQHCAGELEEEILRLGARNVAAFIFEPVVGAAGGVVPAPDGYARLVRDICDRHGVILIADEVMCGAGRCGTWRALSYDGVSARHHGRSRRALPEAMCRSAPPIYHERVATVLEQRAGGPMTGHTFHRAHACLRRRCCRPAHSAPRPTAGARQAGWTSESSRNLKERLCDLDAAWRCARPRFLHRPGVCRRSNEARAPFASVSCACTREFVADLSTMALSAIPWAATSMEWQATPSSSRHHTTPLHRSSMRLSTSWTSRYGKR
jgi:hypothetical protein